MTQAHSLLRRHGYVLGEFVEPYPEVMSEALRREHDRLLSKGWKYLGNGDYRK